MARYTVYNGVFNCHDCKQPVSSLRLYEDKKELTWMCKDKHLSVVSLLSKKKRDHYERKI